MKNIGDILQIDSGEESAAKWERTESLDTRRRDVAIAGIAAQAKILGPIFNDKQDKSRHARATVRWITRHAG